MSLSRPIVEAYWLGYVASQQFGGAGQDLGSIASNTPVNVVNIAFYNLFPANLLSMCFGMSQSHGWGYTQSGIKALQAAGVKVTASLIGTPDPSVGWNDIPDPAQFARNVKALFIDNLGCDGINIDNEGGPNPNSQFMAVVEALRSELGPKGGDKALLTYVTYIPSRDLPWLKKVGSAFDWVSTMAYWNNTQGQISLWQQYADVLGPANVLIGVSCCSGSQSTSIATVQGVAQWETQKGAGATGGMMLWNLSGGSSTQTYYEAIRDNLTIWTPPVEGGHVPQLRSVPCEGCAGHHGSSGRAPAR
jgi:hypothetical protein